MDSYGIKRFTILTIDIMSAFTERYVAGFMNDLVIKNPSEPEFHQAVKEVLESVAPVVESSPHFLDQKFMERMTEPEGLIFFRVPLM